MRALRALRQRRTRLSQRARRGEVGVWATASLDARPAQDMEAGHGRKIVRRILEHTVQGDWPPGVMA